MSSYWVNFARNGDPNGKGLDKWPVYDGKNQSVMVFGNPPEGAAVAERGAACVLPIVFR